MNEKRQFKYRIFYLPPVEKMPQKYEFEETSFHKAYEHARKWIIGEQPPETKLLMVAQLTR